MKLIKCYIENFGKLQNFSYEFKNGINIIKEENGFGKTTFATFIKSMFYGLDASNKTEKSDRKKYKPWQGGNFGGNIEFEINDKKYRIERFFGSKVSDDTFKLYNLSTNLESFDFTENIGEEIFKINKSAYERSTYIPQGQIQIEMEDSLRAKLGNVLESDNDVNTSEEAIKNITEAMKIYKKIGNKGLINESKEKLLELQRILENGKIDQQNLETRTIILEEIKSRIKEKESTRKEKQQLLSKKIEQDRINAKKETYNNILQKLTEAEDNYNGLKTFFKNEIPKDEIINDYLLKSIEIEKCKVEIQSNDLLEQEKNNYEMLKNKFQNKNITEEEINEKIVYYSEIQQIDNDLKIEKNNEEITIQRIDEIKEKNKNEKKKLKVISIINCIIISLGIYLLWFANLKLPGILLIISQFILLVYNVFKLKRSKNLKQFENERISLSKIQKKIEDLNEKRKFLDTEINKLIGIYGQEQQYDRIITLTNLKTEINLYKSLENKKSAKELSRQNLLLKMQMLQKELEEFLLKYFREITDTYSNLLQEIKIRKNELVTVTNEMEKNLKHKYEYEQMNDIEKLTKTENMENIDEEELNIQVSNYNLEIDKLNDEKNQIKNQIEILENKIFDNEYIESDMEFLKEQIEEMEKKYSILEKTKNFLTIAKENFSSRYINEMVEGFEKYLSLIDDKEMKTDIDINLDIKIDVKGSKKEVKYFSYGYKDLLYICIRFSLIKALFKEEKPFVILDDPFVNLDEVKTKKVIDLIKNISDEYQIIYFVCHNSRT